MSAPTTAAPLSRLFGVPPAERRSAGAKSHERDRAIIYCLKNGLSVADMAGRIGVSEKRMRALIGEVLGRRAPAPPKEFITVQAGRLNAALSVASGAMTAGNLKAVDGAVRIVRELDRHRGGLAFDRPEFWPQAIEKVDSAPGNTESASGLAEESAWAGFAEFGPAEQRGARPGIPAQAIEKVDSAPGNTEPEAEIEAVGRLPSRRPAGSVPRGRGDPRAARAPYDPLDGFAPLAVTETAAEDDGRPGIPAQAVEKIDSAPGNAEPEAETEAAGRLPSRRPAGPGAVRAQPLARAHAFWRPPGIPPIRL